jgi:multidrug efflux system membrane fusion protein
MENKFSNILGFFYKLSRRQKIGAGGVGLIFLILLKIISNYEKPTYLARIPKVVVRNLEASLVTPTLHLTGHTEAFTRTTIKAEMSGKVSALLVSKGQMVKKGTPLLSLENADCLEKVAQAKANLEHKEAEFESATKLKKKDFYSQNNLLAAKTDLELAKATLARAAYDAENLTVKAPYDGYYDNVHAEVGEYISAGTHVVSFLQPNPTKIRAMVSEQEHAHLAQGAPCTVTIREKNFEAKVTYLSHKAEEKTRTYALECVLDDAHVTFPDGLTASISIPKPSLMAHKIPASALTLNDQGVLGLMVVHEGKAQFFSVQVVQSTSQETLVTGPPNTIQLILVGGEFVKPNQPVEIVQ